MIYLDYAATTPVDERVVDTMLKYLGREGLFANSASPHVGGIKAANAIETARHTIASYINAEPDEIVFTSGATEANNLALKGLMQFYQRSGKHIIVGAAEHASILDSAKALSQQGFRVTYLTPNAEGLYSLTALEEAIEPDTLLISIMHVNNETGVIQDIKKIAEYAKSRGLFFHTDATQSVGKLPIDVKQMSIDLMSFSAHKLYGPKGIGALYVRKTPRTRLIEQINGGRHESGLRSGTLATHQIMGFAKAVELMSLDNIDFAHLRQHFLNGIADLDNIYVNAPKNDVLPQIINITIEGVDNQLLIKNLPDVAFSAGAACSSTAITPSHVLKAMGLTNEQAKQTVRFSFGRYTTIDELDQVITLLRAQIKLLRENTR